MNPRAVIAGGTHGVGLAIARAVLACEGQVLITGRDERKVEVARDALGPRAFVLRSDATSMADVEALGGVVADRLGAVDAVFLTAWCRSALPFAEVTEAEYDRVFGVNAKGAFFTAQRLLPLVRDGGSLVFTVAAAGALCSGATAAVSSFAGALAAELAARAIRVHAGPPDGVLPEVGRHLRATPHPPAQGTMEST